MDKESPRQDIDISVSIVNWNTRQDLLECLESIIPDANRSNGPGASFALDGVSCEVIVVDNNSEDASATAVRRAFPVAQVLTQDSNLGFAAGNNRAFAAARGRYVLVLNPDATVQPGAIAALVRFADEHRDAGIIGPKVLNADGSVQPSARAFPTLAAGLFRNSILGRYFPDNKYTRDYLQTGWDHADARPVDWVTGAAMLLRREALEDARGFDEDYFMYVEDVDICWRARKAGWSVWYCPDAVVIHRKARASDLVPNRMIYQHHRSMYTFFKKNYRPNASLAQCIITPLGLAARAGYFIARNKLYKWLHGKR